MSGESPTRRTNWIAGLQPPGLERRLDIAGHFLVEKITVAGVKRTVRRLNPAPKAKRPCFVCGRHAGISQSHHLIEVGRVASVLHVLAIFDWAPIIPTVSLCPNHHAYVHALRRARSPLSDDVARELSEGEWDRLVELGDRRSEAHDGVWQEVRREFLAREEAYRQSTKGQGEG